MKPFQKGEEIARKKVAALMKDLSGNFDLSFYVMGGLMTLSGLICFPLRRLRDYEMSQERKREEMEMGEQ